MTTDSKKMNIICTSCPVGCALTVFEDGNGDIIVDGNMCRRGKSYAIDEFSDPKRMVTSSVKIEGGVYSMISVKTDKPIKKELVWKALKIIKNSKVKAPINIGDIIEKDIEGTDVSIVATRKVDAV